MRFESHTYLKSLWVRTQSIHRTSKKVDSKIVMLISCFEICSSLHENNNWNFRMKKYFISSFSSSSQFLKMLASFTQILFQFFSSQGKKRIKQTLLYLSPLFPKLKWLRFKIIIKTMNISASSSRCQEVEATLTSGFWWDRSFRSFLCCATSWKLTLWEWLPPEILE